MDLTRVKSISIPQGNVFSIAYNGVVLWRRSERYIPIRPTDETRYPMALNGFVSHTITGNETLSSDTNACWNLSNFPSKGPSQGVSYAYCNRLSPTNAIESPSPPSIGRYDKVLTSSYGIAIGYRYEGKYMLMSEMTAHLTQQYNVGTPYIILFAPLNETPSTIWVAVKDTFANTYGYYNRQSKEYVAAYGMTGTEVKRIEYLESTGTQYIDTGFIPNSNSKVVLDAYYTKVDPVILFGSRLEDVLSSDKFTINISSSKFANGWGSNSTFFAGGADTSRHAFTLSSDGGYVDGTKIANVSGSFTGTKETYLFAVHQGDGASLFASAKVYSLKLWDNGILVRDFLPVRIGTTGYMLDTVEWKLYANSGTGVFTYGNDAPWEWS